MEGVGERGVALGCRVGGVIRRRAGPQRPAARGAAVLLERHHLRRRGLGGRGGGRGGARVVARRGLAAFGSSFSYVLLPKTPKPRGDKINEIDEILKL